MKRPLLPKYERMLLTMGENIRLARLRRDLTSEQISERAGISRTTLIKIEHGDEGVHLIVQVDACRRRRHPALEAAERRAQC